MIPTGSWMRPDATMDPGSGVESRDEPITRSSSPLPSRLSRTGHVRVVARASGCERSPTPVSIES